MMWSQWPVSDTTSTALVWPFIFDCLLFTQMHYWGELVCLQELYHWHKRCMAFITFHWGQAHLSYIYGSTLSNWTIQPEAVKFSQLVRLYSSINSEWPYCAYIMWKTYHFPSSHQSLKCITVVYNRVSARKFQLLKIHFWANSSRRMHTIL